MALELSTKAKLLSQKLSAKPQVILKIDGFPEVFGAVDVNKLVRIGNDITIGQFVIGGQLEDPNSRPWINLDGSTKNYTQQIDIDKGGASSIGRVTVELIDKNNELTKIFSPGVRVSDIMGRKASYFLSFADGSHPEDSVEILNGVIDDYESGSGKIKLTISHPETLKEQEIFVKISTRLTAGIDDTTTTVPAETVVGMLQTADTDIFQTYVRINDEIMEYTNISGNDLTVDRAELGTIAASHAAGDDIETIYRLKGDAIELALAVLLSGGKEFFLDNVPAPAFQQLNSTEFVENGILFPEYTNLEKELGLVIGDKFTVEGATEAGNNVTEALIASFGQSSSGAYLVTTEDLTTETDSSAVVKFKSKYNSIGTGCRMTPQQVDVPQFERIKRLFPADLIDFDFRLKDTIKAKELIDQKFLYASGLFSVPRKGKVSLNRTAPPIAEIGSKIYNETNVKNPSKLKTKRSLNRNYYNGVVYRYDPSDLEEKFKLGDVIFSQESKNRLGEETADKILTIDADGLRPITGKDIFIEKQTGRILDRYKFAAESLMIEVLYGEGYAVEIGDTCVLDASMLQLSDSQNGTRSYVPRIFEIVNKSLNVKNGNVRLSLLDTNFGADGRFALISPASKVGPGADTQNIPIVNSFTTPDTEIEQDKWSNVIGFKVKVHDEKFTQVAESELVGLKPGFTNVLVLDPPLPFTPDETFTVRVANYQDSSAAEQAVIKAFYAFFCPQVEVLDDVGNTSTQFKVDEVDKFFVGSPVRVHNEDFSEDFEASVTDIAGDVITVSEDLGFTPDSTHVIDLIGFKDQGNPYRLF